MKMWFSLLCYRENISPTNFFTKKPNFLTRKAISTFSEPQMSIPSSYEPTSKKNSRSIDKAQPMCEGDLIGAVTSDFVRSSSLCGIDMLLKKKYHDLIRFDLHAFVSRRIYIWDPKIKNVLILNFLRKRYKKFIEGKTQQKILRAKMTWIFFSVQKRKTCESFFLSKRNTLVLVSFLHGKNFYSQGLIYIIVIFATALAFAMLGGKKCSIKVLPNINRG